MILVEGRRYACSCGARGGDVGELAEHMITFLERGDLGHHVAGPEGLEEPSRVTELRQRVDRRHAIRQKLAEATGVTVEDLREALRHP